MHKGATNVEHEMYEYTGPNWSHWNSDKKFKENLEAKPGKHSIDALQKAVTLGALHIRKLLQSGPGSLSGGDRRWSMKSAKHKGSLTRDYYYYYYYYYYDDDINIKVLIKQIVRQRSCFKAGRILINILFIWKIFTINGMIFS
jgi:hypothetical protein